MISAHSLLATVAITTASTTAFSATYRCDVTERYGFGTAGPVQRSTAADIAKWKPYLIVEDGADPKLQRCSFSSSAGRVTCDEYRIDKVTTDTNVGLKKFYLFASQFDLQLTRDLIFIENNGRGQIATGQCKLQAP